MTTELRSYVGGNWHDGARLVEDINPAKPSEAVAQVSMSNASLAVAAVEAASAATADWRRTPAPARGEILRLIPHCLRQFAKVFSWRAAAAARPILNIWNGRAATGGGKS